jgi:hypothetical protein
VAIQAPTRVYRDDLRPLGEINGRPWFEWTDFELRRRPGVLRDALGEIPLGLHFSQSDGPEGRTYVTFDGFAKGAYAEAKAAADRGPAKRPPKPLRYVTGVRSSRLTEGTPVRYIDPNPASASNAAWLAASIDRHPIVTTGGVADAHDFREVLARAERKYGAKPLFSRDGQAFGMVSPWASPARGRGSHDRRLEPADHRGPQRGAVPVPAPSRQG